MTKFFLPGIGLALWASAGLAQNPPLAATRRAEWIQFNPVTPLTAASFAKPPAVDLPWVRMNMPATADPAEIAAEVRVMRGYGIGGVEIGQGAFPNNEQLVALLRAANQVGIKVSLSHGPTQNPAGYSIDDDHARKTLVVGKAVVSAGEAFDGHLPPPTLTAGGRSGFGGLPQAGPGPAAAAPGRGAGGGGGGRGNAPQTSRATLIAVLAYRCTQSPCPATGPADLDRASLIDLTSAVSAKNTGDIWIEKQLAPLRKWVRKYNNVLRVQVEGEASMTTPITDMVLATAAVDRPEHENLFVGDEVDNYLPMASANHMTGNPWYSTECCAALGQAYAETFQDAIIRMHRSFVGGITKLVYHVYPYRDGATWKWPGYHNFGQAGFSNAWGPRNPFWVDAPAYNDYLARNQQVLTQGDAKTDVAVYMQNYLYPPSQGYKYRAWGDPKLWEAGYTRDYLNPAMLNLANATVTGKRLAADGPAYKALIIDSEQGPPTDPVKTSMPVDAARKILGYARAGLPVIVVGTPPDRTPGNTPDADPTLRSVIAELLRERSVSRVAHESDVPDKLRSLGIRPAAEPGAPSTVLSIRRRDVATRTDYYFFYNQGIVSPPDEPRTLFEPATGEPVDREFSLEGNGQPYLLDGWSGKITPLVNYSSSGGRVTLRLHLAPDNGLLIALSDQPNRFGFAPPRVHVTKTNADDAGVLDGAVVIRASAPGSYTTTLGPRRRKRGRIASNWTWMASSHGRRSRRCKTPRDSAHTQQPSICPPPGPPQTGRS